VLDEQADAQLERQHGQHGEHAVPVRGVRRRQHHQLGFVRQVDVQLPAHQREQAQRAPAQQRVGRARHARPDVDDVVPHAPF
jgi:hypothetical protein